MNDTDRSILATLAYYGAFNPSERLGQAGWPLTAMELIQRLIPARRLGGGDREVTLAVLLERLEVLEKLGMVTQEDGLYALAPAVGFARERVRMEKESVQKWRRLRRKAWLLQAPPFVRALFASGSLALGNVEPQSDWDVLVVAQAGRLYTARLGLLVIAKLTGVLRTKRDRNAPDKFCFNHYLASDGLALRHRSLYTAQGLAALIPIVDPQHMLRQLWQENSWISQYRPQPENTQFVRREIIVSVMLCAVRWCGEGILRTPLGDLVERGICAWMQRRIARTPATHESGGRITANDQELEFHPRSFEAVALARYNAALDRLGLGAYAEQDSGLTK